MTVLTAVPGIEAQVPALYEVSLGGRGYLVERDAQPPFAHISIPMLRTQRDESGAVGENSLNSEGQWRRSFETWHGGAGQSHFDRADSVPERFDRSLGVNVWERWQLSRMNSATSITADGSAGLVRGATGMYVVPFHGPGKLIDENLNEQTMTGVPTTQFIDVGRVSGSGARTFVSYRNNNGVTTSETGIYEYANNVATRVNALDHLDALDYVLGRLMVGRGVALYNITDLTATTAPGFGEALFQHPDKKFKWAGFASSTSTIYAAGASGIASEVYKIRIKPDGSGLDVPSVAATLPAGETIMSIFGYLGYIVLGTTLGIRFAVPDTDGNLTLGALVDIGRPVRSFTAEGSYIYFTWEGFPDQETNPEFWSGTGRLDLTHFTSELVPAYATDVMISEGVTANYSQVRSIERFAGLLYFHLHGDSTYRETPGTSMDQSWLDTGAVSWGIPDDKRLLEFEVTGVGSISYDTGPFFSTILTGFPTGSEFEFRLEPLDKLTRATVKAFPVVDTSEFILLPLQLFEQAVNRDSLALQFDVDGEVETLKALRQTRAVVVYDDGDKSRTVTVEDYDWRPELVANGQSVWNGVMYLRLKVIA